LQPEVTWFGGRDVTGTGRDLTGAGSDVMATGSHVVWGGKTADRSGKGIAGSDQTKEDAMLKKQK